MGIDLSTHIGPFFRCKPSKGPVKIKRRGCANKSCKNNGSETWDRSKQFCELCGSAITNYEKEITADLQHPFEIACEILNESLSNIHKENCQEIGNFHVFVANRRSADFSKCVDNKGETAYLEITSEMVDKQKKMLSENFAKELIVLQEQYGKNNVEICWGVICEMS